MAQTVAELKGRLQAADEEEFAVLERALAADERKGVRAAVETARRRLVAEAAERERALAWAVRYVEPAEIDAAGMTACLVTAFRRALAAVEEVVRADVVLLDGNPLHLDAREVNVVKGDGRCASIAAASVVAKVERDRLMEAYDAEYPGYGFAENKGYASAAHIEAIRERGLTPIHRASFCTAFSQPTLF